MNTEKLLGLCAVIFIIGALLGVILGASTMNKAWKEITCQRGYAEWSVNHKGEATWDWKVKE